MSWELKKLEDLCVFKRGLTYSKRDEVEESNNRVLRATNIDLETHTLNLEEIRFINDKITVKQEKKIKQNDILICTASGSKSHLGKVALIDSSIDFAFGGFMGVLRANKKILPQYLFKNLISQDFKNHIAKLGDGTNINNLRFDLIKDYQIPLPPLPVQKQIVEKLDVAFANIDTVSNATQKNVISLNNLKSSILNQIFTAQSTVMAGWETVKLGEVLKTAAGGTPLKSKKEYYEGGELSWLLSGAVCQKEITSSTTFINKLGLDNSSAKIFPHNTVLMALYGATAGQVGILRFPSATNQAICGIYPSDNYLPEFIYYYLLSYKDTLLEQTSGVAQPNLSQIKIRNVPIPLPPLPVQKQIVEKLDVAFANIDKASSARKNKITLLNNLKSSILNQAFAGELTKDG